MTALVEDLALPEYPAARLFAEVIREDGSEIDRDEWLELRRHGIGGSDATVIAGLSNYTAPFGLWLDKTGQIPSDEAGEAAEWGRLLEPVVRDATARRLDTDIVRVPFMLQSIEHPFMLANLDGAVPDWGAVYEGKTASQYKANEWADDQVPDGYQIQGMHCLAVTGRDLLVFAALIGGQRLVVRTLRRDDELIANLVTLEAEFWDHVVAGEPPPPDGSKACTDLLANLWDVRPESVLQLDDPAVVAEVRNIIAERHRAHADVKAAEAVKDELSNRLRAICTEHEVVTDGEGRKLFSWKRQSKSGTDLALMKRVHTDLVAGFATTTTNRVLHVPAPKKEKADG